MHVFLPRRAKQPCARRAFLRRCAAYIAAGAVLAAGAATAAPASDAAQLNLDAYRGKVVYLDFWASWCHPCEKSFPYMEELKRLYGSQGLEIIAVNVDHSRSLADAFLARNGGSYLHIVYDPKGEIATRFGVKDMPTSILIGRDGRVRYVHQGFFPEKIDEYDSHISELVHENQ